MFAEHTGPARLRIFCRAAQVETIGRAYFNPARMLPCSRDTMTKPGQQGSREQRAQREAGDEAQEAGRQAHAVESRIG